MVAAMVAKSEGKSREKGEKAMKKLMACVLVGLFMTGCTYTKATVNPSFKGDRAARQSEEVQLLYKEPTQPYTEIAIISSKSRRDLDVAIKEMRAKAAALGADAIIIRDTDAAYAYMTVIGSAIVFEK